MPRYSIIIPTYNAATTLVSLLESLEAQTMRDFEVIVIDDASTDDTPQAVERFDLRYYRQERRQGPAAARNRGAALAGGEWLVYADADTVFAADTMEQIDKALRDCDADALVGSYAGRPANPGFMPRYKGLWEQVAIDGVLAAHGGAYIPYNTWAPRPGVVKKDVFESAGGFSESFKGADLEDMDLGYRLTAAGRRIYFVPAIKIKHHYPATFWKEIRPFARRCVIWMGMKRSHGLFDAAGEGSPVQALAHMTGFAAFGLFVLGLLWPVLWLPAAVLLAAYFAAAHGFIFLTWREEGLWFAVRAAGVYWVHTIVLGFAAGYGLMRRMLNRT